MTVDMRQRVRCTEAELANEAGTKAKTTASRKGK
jgi:hypothetical protein